MPETRPPTGLQELQRVLRRDSLQRADTQGSQPGKAQGNQSGHGETSKGSLLAQAPRIIG
ncbi:hypothetical protein LZ30DRAFT_711076 [Colletotrichum cereale]|nr:hypothetical protein LZ30DRAFT_711076 [Colletotrichum cereale]